jgi:hypothetical protein
MAFKVGHIAVTIVQSSFKARWLADNKRYWFGKERRASDKGR